MAERERERERERDSWDNRDRERDFRYRSHALIIDEEQRRRRRREPERRAEAEEYRRRRRRIDDDDNADADGDDADADADRDDIQSLLFDNQRLAATNLSLKQDLAVAQRDLQKLSVASNDVKSHRDSQVRLVYERSLKVEADLRLLNLIKAELNQVLEDKHQLSQDNLNLTHQLNTIQTDLDKARSLLDRFPLLEDELQTISTDIQTGRAAIQFEKKTRTSNLDHQKTMDDNIIIMSRHIHKLHTRLANADHTSLLTAPPSAAGYGSNYASTGAGYHPLNPYMNPLPPHQVQVGADGISQYGHVTPQNGPIGMQPPNVQT